MSQACPLCRSPVASDFHRDSRRDYRRCPACCLVFVPPGYRLPAPAEKAHYDLHRNSPEDQGYRLFLSRLFLPLQESLPPGSRGLDFGSGPGPTLSVMFTEAGHSVATYDKFYAPDSAVFSEQYDFITATEVVEHLSDPDRELARLWTCLRPGGWLGIMTKLALDLEAFASWHYKNDPTHICFFSRATFAWLAVRWQAELTFVGSDVVILRKGKREAGSGKAGGV
jgi:SAM-dependent methyltransferase